MPQNFLACDREQSFLFPPDVRDWLPEGHLAWFVIDAVEEILALCSELPQLVQTAVVLVTGDTAMRLRAKAQGTAKSHLDESTYATVTKTADEARATPQATGSAGLGMSV